LSAALRVNEVATGWAFGILLVDLSAACAGGLIPTIATAQEHNRARCLQKVARFIAASAQLPAVVLTPAKKGAALILSTAVMSLGAAKHMVDIKEVRDQFGGSLVIFGNLPPAVDGAIVA
tara:strand:- start:1 stop:360 length:360 start_codon:yes stop_codon:yes gene_type:complete